VKPTIPLRTVRPLREAKFVVKPALMKPIKIVSGGQTGTAREALDWALAQGLECRGWCPKGPKAEDGPIDPKYPLKETPSAAYVQRTEWNMRDSDVTVSFSIEPTLTGGSLKTMDFARKQKKTAPASLRGRQRSR
jgi:Circularly permutated YpsA SLOG family